MKIYTKTGDQGTTCLLSGKGKVSKDDERVIAMGDIDELNVAIGKCRVMDPPSDQFLKQIQRKLMDIMTAISKNDYSELIINTVEIENYIDELERDLKPLTQFILPGSCEEEVAFHSARVIARRAERSTVKITNDPGTLSYLNRLSDLFFVMSRIMTKNYGEIEIKRYDI